MQNYRTGKVVMVTGANSGIGLATAAGLAKMGATVVMVARNREKGEAALAQVKAESRNPNVRLMLADLSLMTQVRRLAEDFKRDYDRLDVLINNAAIIPAQREITPEGIEVQFATNHLAYFLLTNLLLDTLKCSTPARIVNVSSNLHDGARLDFDDLQGENNYRRMGWTHYGSTKLYNLLFTYELARRLQNTGVTANALHPGVIGTNLSRTMPKLLQQVYTSVMPKPEDGAKTSIYLATSPDVEGVTGKYFVNRQQKDSSAESHDAAAAKRLWDISAEMTGLSQTEIPQMAAVAGVGAG